MECARILVNSGAEINAADPDDISPVLMAMINGHYDFAAFLLDQGADPNLADETGRTALYAAVDMHTMPASNRPSPNEIGQPAHEHGSDPGASGAWRERQRRN